MLSDAQYLSSTPADGEDIKKLLDSRLEREKMVSGCLVIPGYSLTVQWPSTQRFPLAPASPPARPPARGSQCV